MPPSEESRRRLALFALPPGQPFADRLAALMLAEAEDPDALARQLVILPGNRAVASLQRAFLRATAGRPLLLPRMIPAGEVEASGALDALLAGTADEALTLAPMGALARQLRLARLLDGAGLARGGRALALAAELAEVLDTLAIAEVPLQRLCDAARELGASHWERNRRIVELVARAWPALAREAGAIDPVARRERLLGLLATHWRKARPELPVTIAGFSAAPPAVRALMAAALALPRGRVVLSGFDPGLTAADWARLAALDSDPALRREAELHPQHGLLQILGAVGARAEDVRALGDGPWEAGARLPLLRAAAAPAAVPATGPAGSAQGLRLAQAETVQEEALVIALAMRETLETPGRTAALVTPDRALARRVAGQLLRFGLKVDDSAGTELRLTLHGRLLAALAEAAATRLAPVPLVSLLANPLLARAREGEAAARWRDGARGLDRALRGVRPPAGLAAIGERLARSAPEHLGWWEAEVAPALSGLDALGAGAPIPLGELVAALRVSVDRLSTGAAWAGPEGHALARLVEEAGEADLPVAAGEAGAVVDAMLSGTSVRPQHGQHPRLAILGLVEARFETADLLILGGLNEGSWPAPAAADPWLAPGLRRQLGLPSVQARIGLQAQDFLALAAGAAEVLLTRSRRSEAGPEAPSRFLLKLELAARGTIEHETRLVALARALDQPDAVRPASRPAPSPPAHARPRRIAASALDMLAADPFSFWAREIVRLEPLEPLDADPTAADRGTAVHAILERWLGRGQDRAQVTEEELLKLGGGPALALLWRPRIERMLDWVAEDLAADRANGWIPIAFETAGELALDGATLHGKADRVDRKDGCLRILDYKTGSAPSKQRAEEGYALQLPALAMLAQAGALAAVPAAEVAALLFAELRGSASRRGAKMGGNWKWNLAAAEARIRRIVADHLAGSAPFPAKRHPIYAETWRTFDHFARLGEWFGREGEPRHG